MIDILNRTHNILSASQETIPKKLKGHTLICYLPDRDAIVIAGWKESTALIAELIANYLELTPSEHEETLKVPTQLGMPDMVLKIHRTFEAIYQIRNGNKE